MKKENDFYDKLLYVFTNYIMVFLVTDIAFLITIFPLVGYLLSPIGSWKIYDILLLSVLLGPAMTALSSAMQKLIREKDISPFSDYFKAYKVNFGQGLYIGSILSFAMIILYFDVNYFFQKNNNLVACICIAAIIIILILSLNIYAVLARFNLKTKDIFKISARMFIKKIYIPIAYVLLAVVIIWFIYIIKQAIVGALIGISIFTYCVAFMQKADIEELEIEIQEKYNVE